MNKFVLYAFVLLLGILSALINSANGLLASNIGLLESIFIVHLIALIASIIYYVLLEKNKSRSIIKIIRTKPYLILGGFIGSFVVLVISYSVQHIGVLLVSTALVVGQFLLSFIIDTKGLFGFTKVPLTRRKIFSIVIMLIGVAFLSI